MPGTKSQLWPEGLPEFVERLDTMEAMSFWKEPLDILGYGVEFLDGARKFIDHQIERIQGARDEMDLNKLYLDLGLAVRAIIGFAVLSADNNLLIEGVAIMSKIEATLDSKACRAYFELIGAHLRKYLSKVQEQYLKKNNFRYLDTTKTSGVFSIAKFVSFAQQHENNTSIATDGEYLFMFVAIPQKAMMYKIGTGSTDSTIPGKIYIEKKADREGDVSWTYCQGKLFSRRVNEEFGVVTLYDADTLNTIGDAKLMSSDIFSSSNCQQANRYYPILSDGKNIYIVTMKVSQKRRTIKPDMRKQYQQIQDDKKKTSEAKSVEVEKEKKSDKDAQLEKKKDIERKLIERKLIEMQAREEELLRSKVAAQRGGRGRRGGRASREYGRGGARVPPDGRRGIPNEETHELKLNGNTKESSQNDPSSFKVCQFYLHEFKTTEPKTQTPANYIVGDQVEAITEIEQAFCGFFDASECDMALKDHNLDACEAAYQLACDAEENRYKLTLPLSRSVLLCESLVTSEPANAKKGNEGDLQVAEDSILTPACLQSGKWVINGDNITYHQNVMQENTMLHIFSTNDLDEKPMTHMSKQRSSPLPTAQMLGGGSLNMGKNGGQPSQAAQLLAKDFYEHGLDSIPDPSGLFDFKQPDLARDRDFFKQMILNGEDMDEFGDAPMDFFAKEFKQLQVTKNIEGDDLSASESQKDEIEEKDMFEEIRLLGTHRISLKNQEGLNPNYRGTITYDKINRKYYVLVLANQQRYVAVISDLHRFSENFSRFESDADQSIQSLKVHSMMDLKPDAFASSQEFQQVCFKLLLSIEAERFNMPWRWNQWSNLYSHSISYKHLRDQAFLDQAHLQLQPLSQQLAKKKSESNANNGGKDQAQIKVLLKEKLVNQQKNKQIQKLQSRLQKVTRAETEQLRKEYGFEYQEKQGRLLQELLERKTDDVRQGQRQSNTDKVKLQSQQSTDPLDQSKIQIIDDDGPRKQVEGQKEACPVREMAKQNLKNIYEKAKTFIISENSKVNPPAYSSALLSDISKPQQVKLNSQPELSMTKSLNHFKSISHERYVAPVEHIIVHREIKKIYAFCQSGSVSTLRHLLCILTNNCESDSGAAFRRCILQQILVWATFADQLSPLHRQDLELLDSVRKVILKLLNSENQDENEKQLCWKILILGWDQFCRTTLQQIEVLELALAQSSSQMTTQKDSDASLSKEQEPCEGYCFYDTLLGTGSEKSPLELFYTRFFRSHDSFYQLEILNKSIVKSYLVLVETQFYKKVINQLQNIQQDSTDQPPQSFAEQRLFDPIRRGVLEKPLRCAFDDYQTVPITLSAISSEVPVPSAAVQKQGKRKRNAQKAEQVAYRSGFVLEEISWRNFSSSSRDIESSRMRVSSKLFSMPLGSAFTTDPVVVEGILTPELASFRDLKSTKLHLNEQEIIKKYDSEASFGEVSSEQLEKARNAHTVKSTSLIDKFIEAIQQSFQHKCEESHQRFLIKTFVGLAQRAQASNLSPRTASDLELVSKVLKLVQQLLKSEVATFEQKRGEIKVYMIQPLINFVIQMVSMGILADPTNMPLIGYKLLPGLVNVIFLLKETFRVFDQGAPSINLLDCLQALTSEGVDFARERIFETPHPYPQNDFSLSETIEVPKAIGFIVELDKRCSAEHSTDQLVMYSGSDHIFQINQNFATQIKLSTKPNTKQPYFLLGSRMKIDFRSYSHRQRRGQGASYLQQPANDAGGQKKSNNDVRWGYRVIVRPIYSEPQNIVLSGPVRSVQRKQVYTQLGGEQNCHDIEVLLNSLVCLASQFSKELANIEAFSQIRSQPGESAHEPLLTSVKNPAIQKSVKQQLFKGGIANSQLLMGGSSKDFDYHDIIQQELKVQQDQCTNEFKSLLESLENGDEPQSIAAKAPESRGFVPCCGQWTQQVKELVSVEFEGVPQGGSSTVYKALGSQLLDRLHAKVRELVQYPVVVKQRFFVPSAKKHQHEWVELEKLMIVVLLYHSQSLHLAQKFIDIKVPNLKSSGGVFQYGSGLKQGVLSEENYFLIDQLKLVGNQVNDLLMWLILRVQGEMDAQNAIQAAVEVAQQMIDARLEKKQADDLHELEKKHEEEKKLIEEAQTKIQDQIRKKLEEDEESKQKSEQEANAKQQKAPSVAVLVTANKNRKMKKANIVRRAINIKQVAKKGKQKKQDPLSVEENAKPNEELKEEQQQEKSEVAQIQDDAPKYVDLTLSQINELKNQIEQKVYADLSSQYLGTGADPHSLKPLCLLFSLKYNSEDPTETVRQLFKKIKGRLSRVINLDDVEDSKLLQKIGGKHSEQSPYVEVCKDVKSRLLILLEVKPSIEYLNNVTKIDSSKCFSRYGSIKFSQKGGLLRGMNPDMEGSELSKKMLNAPNLKEENSQHDDEHDDELADIMNMDDEDDGEKLAPLGIERSKSQQIGLRTPSFQKSLMKKGESTNIPKSGVKPDQDSQWLEIHRRWKQWNRFHKASSLEDRDLTSPFCSPLHSVLQFAKFSEIQDPTPLRRLLCEQQKRAAFRLFALKYQGKLYEIVQGTPYQRFIWGNQSHSLGSSSLDRVESCGETLVNKINERTKKLVKQIMSYTVIQADNMKHYQDILEKYLKQQDCKPTKAGKEQPTTKKSAIPKGRGSPKNGSESCLASAEQQDRRTQKITFDDFIPWQMKTVMHSLNDLRVLLSDPFSQAYVLQALKEDQFKLTNLEKQMKLTVNDVEDEDHNGLGLRNSKTPGTQEQDLGFQNIKQFLKALIQIMLQSNSSSPLAEQFPNSSRLCQSAFKVAKIVLSQFVSDKQQIREAETSKILQEMMLEILVSHLEKVCGLSEKVLDQDSEKDQYQARNLAKAIEETNLDEVVQLLKLLQEIMRISSDTQRALAQHHQHMSETQSAQRAKQLVSSQIQQQSQFLSEGGTQVMRCAKLLAYLMIEFEVPVVVRHAIRCARIFFFGLVDFQKLKLYQPKNFKSDGQEHASDHEDPLEGQLGGCCQNRFILATLKKIGQRISNTEEKEAAEGTPNQEASSDRPEESSLIEGVNKVEEGNIQSTTELDQTKSKRYVVYANINSQNEDYTFLITALYHWELRRPAIAPTQPTDPKLFMQKSSKPAKKEKAEEKVQPDKAESDAAHAKSDLSKPNEPPKQGEVAGADKNEAEKSSVSVEPEPAQVAKQAAEQDLGALESVADLFGEPDSAVDEVIQQAQAQIQGDAQPPVAAVQDDVVDPKILKESDEMGAKASEQVDGVEQKLAQPGEQPNQVASDDNQQNLPNAEEAKQAEQESEKEGLKPADQAQQKEEEAKLEAEDKSLQANFELFKLKKEAEKKCESLLQDILHIEQNKDLFELLRKQQRQSYTSLIGDLLSKDSAFLQSSSPYDAQALAQALAEKRAKNPAAFGSQEALKILRESQMSQAKISLESRLNKISSQVGQSANLLSATGPRQGVSAVIKGAIVGAGSSMSEVNLVPNKILTLGSAASHALSQKLSISSLQTAFAEIVKHSQETIYDDDTPEEQARKLNSRNWNERVLHHLFQAMCIASQLQQRYSVPITEPLEHKEALEVANILQQAYKEQIEPVPINPYLKEEFHHKKLSEGKKLSQFFPFSLKNVTAGCKQPELPPGHAPPVVICQKSLVVTVMTEKFSKDIEKIIESRGATLKALEKNPSDGFRLNVCKNNTKRQGSSVSSCILTLIQFLREILVGQSSASGRGTQSTLSRKKIQSHDQGFNDAASQKSSVAGHSESNHNYNQNEKQQERADQKQVNRFLRQQEMRQQEIMKIINESLQILKTQRWQDINIDDKLIILGLFTVIGGWYGFTRVTAGARVQVQINGCWNEATVIDEGVGKRRVSVILNDDASLSLVKVPHSKIKPHQTSIDKGINEKLNFDDLCQAITFLHEQQQERMSKADATQGVSTDAHSAEDSMISIQEAMISENVLFQMLLKVCSKLNWSKIDQNSQSFSQFRAILIQVTSESSQMDGQSHEDKNKDYLEKQLIESWERIIDRHETKNLHFFAPREFGKASDCKIYLDLKKNKNTQTQKMGQYEDENQKLIDIMKKVVNPYIDTDYVQPRSSYLSGLPEPTIKKNQKEAALKLLFYWEKNVLPTTREFVRSTFQKWEMNYYFEQIRHHLRQGDQRAAIADAMVLWENKVPNGVVLPSENTDWTAKVADECIVDSWALAKITLFKSTSQSFHSGQSSGKTSQIQQAEASLPLIIRLQNLGVQAIVIQVKLVDARYNAVLGEYYDDENFCSHFIWFPVSHLYELDYPLPPRPAGYTRKNLTVNYLQSIFNINSLYARKTLIKFFSSCHRADSGSTNERVLSTSSGGKSIIPTFKKDQFGELKLHDLISWSVQEEFSTNPFDGWIQDLNCAIPIKTQSKDTDSSNQELASQEKLNIQKLIEETSDKIIMEKLQQETQNRNENQAKEGAGQLVTSNKVAPSLDREAASSNPLGIMRDLFKNTVLVLNQFKRGKDQEQAMKDSDAYKTLSELADWVFINWIQMSEQVSSSRAVFDLCKQNQGVRDTLGEGSSNQQLISLHSVIQNSNIGAASQTTGQQSIATLLMFHKLGCNLTPCSKIQFYSDPDQVNLVSEITAGTEAKTTLPPLLLNHGQIWAKVQPGSLALLRREQQLDAQSSLPCAVFQIPKQWSVACWLTDTLSNSFLENCENSIELAKEIYQKLIKAIVQFYQDSYSPQMIKSQVLNLLTRLIRKLRFILRQDLERAGKSSGPVPKLTQEAHFEQIFINQGFIKSILNDMDTFKREEEKALNSTESKEKQLLYSSFLQDSVEFLMTVVIPIDPRVELASYQDILRITDDYLSDLKAWLDPLMKTSLFMHYFNNETKSLPFDLLREIHGQTKLERHQSLDHILLIDKVPIDEELYPKDWLANQVLEMCKKHHARVLNPHRDIHFEEDEYEETTEGVNPAKVMKKCFKIVAVLDGWNHMMPLPDYKDYYEQEGGEFKGLSQIVSSDYRKFIELVDSDTEEEQDAQKNALAAEAERLEEERKQKEAEEQIKPVEWGCEICTYINPMSDSTCGMCGQGRRPSMEQLMAALRKQKQEENDQNQPAAEGSKEQDEGQGDPDSSQMIKHENCVRLKFLAFDIAKIIKVEQKRVAKKQEAENLERLRQQKLKEKEEKASQTLKDKAVAENQGQDLVEAGAPRPKEAEKPVEVGQKEEEKKHQDSDAEKSDEDDDDGQWQDEESGDSGSSNSDQKSHLDMAEVDALEQVEAQQLKGAAELEADQNEDSDPRLKKLAELGYDLSILDADPQFAEALLASADLQEEQAREEERKRKEEEEVLKKKQADEKLRAEKLKELELLKEQGLAVKKVEYHTLGVYHGVEQIQENQNAVRVVFKFLSMRLVDLKTGELTDRSKQVLQEIHTTLREQNVDNICFPDQPFEEQLADYGLTKELIKEMELEEFEQTCSVLVAADVILLFRFLESQGYDYWLQKSAYPSFKPPIKQSSKFNCSLIEKLKEFVEINFCEEKKVIQHLEPYQLRLLSKMEGQSTVLPHPANDRGQIAETVGGNATAQIALGQSPVGLYDDTIISMNASQQGKLHWFNQVTQADISYNWALIKTFSKYFAITVPFINCSTSIADNPDEGAIPITLSAYMSSLRNLCLSNTKYELKHLILKKTSADREKAPVLLFERLKLHSDQGKEVKAKESADKAAAPKETSNSEAPAQIEKNQSKNFEFTQAYEQLKDIDYGVLRPSEPKGTDPHLSFEVYFKGEDVVGMGGPYRQFFSDVSQELQMVVPKSSSEEDGDEAENASTEGQQGQDHNEQSTQQKAYLDLLCPSRNMLRNSEKGKDNFVLNPLKVSAHELSLFNFLGVLMGVCIRTSTNLAIRLPSLVWKQLVGQRLTIDDIEEFDDGIVTELKEILNSTEEDFESKFGDRYFTTTLSDLSTVELEDGGASKALTFQNRAEYARKTLYERMKECELQCEAIKRGICQIIPEALLNMVSYKELEEWIYGKKIIDVELLKRHTEYSKGYGVERKEIQWFWEILREMSQDDRRKFIRFCFAQSTIPPNDEEFERRQLRFLLRPVTADDKKKKEKDIPQHLMDQRLPKADTCFFNFELPAYTSKELMKQKILFAISFDNVSLNAEQEDMQIPDNISHRSHESRDSY